MELNCLLFPSKRNVSVESIASQVVLIPHQQVQAHIYYVNLVNPSIIVKDQFLQVIQGRNRNQPPISIREQMQKLKEVKKNPSRQSRAELYQESLDKIAFQKMVSAASNHVSISPQLEMLTLPISNKQQKPSKPASSPAEPSVKVRGYIPCLFLPGNHKFILYFHGNAFLKYIQQATGHSVLAVEYQGYSIYEGSPSADKIERDIPTVMNYLLKMGLPLQDIFVIGRSIGSGPALSLVSQFKVAGVMLVSPFLSICKLVKDKYGGLASYLIKQRFENHKIIEMVKTPILILHGTSDTIIPHSHSETLYQLSQSKAELLLIDGMTHMSFDFRSDFLLPLQAFFARIKF